MGHLGAPHCGGLFSSSGASSPSYNEAPHFDSPLYGGAAFPQSAFLFSETTGGQQDERTAALTIGPGSAVA